MTKEINVHDCTKKEAIRNIQKVIVKYPTLDLLIVIHGFNNGSAIKEMLKNKYNIHNKRVKKTIPEPFNDGRTWIYLNKSC